MLAKVSLLGREGTFECLELPGGGAPLLGVIPLEALGKSLRFTRLAFRSRYGKKQVPSLVTEEDL